MTTLDGTLSSVTSAPSDSKVEEVSPGYSRMATTHWDLITALEGGTPAMREASEQNSTFYLPRLEKEEFQDWRKRLNTSYLHPGFTQGVRRLSGKPFGKPLVVQHSEKLDPRLQELIVDTDGHGKSMQQLALEMMYDGWSRGIMHCGVDLPQTAGEARSRAEEKRAVPRLLRIKPADLFNWPYSIDDEGAIVLEQIRYRETGTVRDGYELREVERIRVWNDDGTWELWEKQQDDKWSQIAAQPWSYGAGIPLATGYFNQTGFMEAESPMAASAWLNLAHWQSSSRQRWLLDFARTPFLFGPGWVRKDKEGTVVVSMTKLMTTQNPNARLEVIEHEGKAIGAGQADLDDLERRMDEASLQPLQAKQSGTPTAAARWLDERQTLTDAQSAVAETESTLTNALKIAGKWIGVEVPEDVQVTLPGDVMLRRSAADFEKVQKAREANDFPLEAYLQEMQAAGIIGEEHDIEELAQQIEDEQPDDPAELAALGRNGAPAERVPGEPE